MNRPDDRSPTGFVYTPHAREWGVGACLLGLFTIVMVPGCLLAGTVGLSTAGIQWDEPRLKDATRAAYIGLGVLAALGVSAFLMGLCGVISAMARRQAAGIATTGLVLGTMALGACVFAWFVIDGTRADVRSYLDNKAKFRNADFPQPRWQVPGEQ